MPGQDQFALGHHGFRPAAAPAGARGPRQRGPDPPPRGTSRCQNSCDDAQLSELPPVSFIVASLCRAMWRTVLLFCDAGFAADPAVSEIARLALGHDKCYTIPGRNETASGGDIGRKHHRDGHARCHTVVHGVPSLFDRACSPVGKLFSFRIVRGFGPRSATAACVPEPVGGPTTRIVAALYRAKI